MQVNKKYNWDCIVDKVYKLYETTRYHIFDKETLREIQDLIKSGAIPNLKYRGVSPVTTCSENDSAEKIKYM